MRLFDVDRFDLDATYSTGKMWDGLKTPRLKFDIEPAFPEVEKADVLSLPLESESIGSAMFDPPFLATTGKSLKKSGDSNVIAKRFGVYPNESKLHTMYYGALDELYRVLTPGGLLVFKCQDKVSSGHQYFSHVYVHDYAIETGFYPKDLFILVAKSRLVAKWQRKQQHARKYHCYFWVFQKGVGKINKVLRDVVPKDVHTSID